MWEGPAASAWLAAVDTIPPDLRKLSRSYLTASSAVNGYASTLLGLKAQSSDLLTKVQSIQSRINATWWELQSLDEATPAGAQRSTELWQRFNSLVAERRHCQAKAEDIRNQHRNAARVLQRRMNDAADLGIRNRNFVERMRDVASNVIQSIDRDLFRSSTAAMGNLWSVFSDVADFKKYMSWPIRERYHRLVYKLTGDIRHARIQGGIKGAGHRWGAMSKVKFQVPYLEAALQGAFFGITWAQEGFWSSETAEAGFDGSLAVAASIVPGGGVAYSVGKFLGDLWYHNTPLGGYLESTYMAEEKEHLNVLMSQQDQYLQSGDFEAAVRVSREASAASEELTRSSSSWSGIGNSARHVLLDTPWDVGKSLLSSINPFDESGSLK